MRNHVLVLILLLAGLATAQDELVPVNSYARNTSVTFPAGTLELDGGWCMLFSARYTTVDPSNCYTVVDVDALEYQAAFLASFTNAGYKIERESRIAENQTAWVLTHPDWAHELTVVISVFPEERTTSTTVILKPRL